MKITGMINDEEREEVKEYIKDIIKSKGKNDQISSGFMGVYLDESFSQDKDLFFVYRRDLALITVSSAEIKKILGEIPKKKTESKKEVM